MNTEVATPARATPRDARRLWRTLLAVVVPIPWLAKGIQYIAHQPSFDHTADQIAYDRVHDIQATLRWFDVLFVVLVVPSIVAMVMVSRRGAPLLATAAAILMAGGFLTVLPLNTNVDHLAWVAARDGFDPEVLGRFIDAADATATVSLGIAGFLVAIVFGSVLVALALWRSRAVAGWAALLIGIGGATHVVIAGLGHVVHGSGLVVLAIGCIAVSARLLTMSDDEFDLPPTGPR